MAGIAFAVDRAGLRAVAPRIFVPQTEKVLLTPRLTGVASHSPTHEFPLHFSPDPAASLLLLSALPPFDLRMINITALYAGRRWRPTVYTSNTTCSVPGVAERVLRALPLFFAAQSFKGCERVYSRGQGFTHRDTGVKPAKQMSDTIYV